MTNAAGDCQSQMHTHTFNRNISGTFCGVWIEHAGARHDDNSTEESSVSLDCHAHSLTMNLPGFVFPAHSDIFQKFGGLTGKAPENVYICVLLNRPSG